ncbi:MAG: rhomboid family intramembrane serine protease [Acidobacteriota bacterium]|nr:rhomboid family intramembrane serine protease [Acidobacteriota bacterium]
MTIPDWPPPAAPPACYAHPDRVAGSVCRRCGRPICPECMREAPVGWQCGTCVRQDSRTAPVTRWRPSPVGRSGRLGNSRITPMTIALIVVNVIAYLYEQRHLDYNFETKYFLVPMLVHQHWYALITSAFLHASGTHILLNMISLAIVGPAVEAEVGPVRFVVLYLLSALGGSVGFYLLAPQNEAGVGASGAIFGLMGAYFVVARMRGWPTQPIIVLLVINGAYSFSGGIAWQDHLGGLVFGALGALGLMWTPRSMRRPSEMAQLVQGLAVVIAGVAVLVALLQIPPGHVNI